MIRLLYDITIGGIRHGKGSVMNLDSATEASLMASGEADKATGVFSRDYGGNIVGLEGDSNIIPITLSYTWATRPNAFTSSLGTIINISDVGGAGGSLWKAIPEGWVPVNGTVKLASKFGTIVSPAASITGSTGALFAPSNVVGALTIPATMLIPGHSILRVRAVFHRRGANATASTRIYVGTAGTSSDAFAYSLPIAATDTLETRPEVEIGVIGSNSMISSNWLSPGNTGASPAPALPMTININTNAVMTLSFGVSSANASDSFDLIGFSVVLESI
jgi:hypothetical protein